MKLILEVVLGPEKGRQFVMDRHDTFVVGRSPDAHFQLPEDDPYFSRNHFLIEFNPPYCRLIDLDSRNGTRVNRERVTQVGLKSGDLILGGKTLIRVVIEGRGTPSTENPPAVVRAKPATPQATPVAEETLIPRGAIHRGKMPAADANRAESDVRPVARGTIQLPAGSILKDVGKTTGPASHSHPESPAPTWPNLPGYQILRKIGQGGMGVVFEAISTVDSRRYAVKVIKPDIAASEDDVSRFLREADILKSLCHPSIVGFHELRQAGGHLCIVMDFVDGPTLADFVVQQQGLLSPSAAVELILPLLDALGFAHAEGFVHRDVKPSNVLVSTGTNSNRLVRLADFGLARVYQSSKLSGLTITGEIGGSAHFMPPEQITMFRHVSPLADQFSAAATLYFALTRKTIHDFPAEVSQQLLTILQYDAVSLGVRRPSLPRKLVTCVDRALSRNPEHRHPDVRSFREELLDAVDS